MRLRTRVSLLKQYAGFASTTATLPLLMTSSYSDTAAGGVRGQRGTDRLRSLVIFLDDFHAALIILKEIVTLYACY